MPGAAKAWMISATLHIAALAAVLTLWRGVVTAESDVGIAVETIVLDEPPAILPAVVAAPLPGVAADSSFTPIAYREFARIDASFPTPANSQASHIASSPPLANGAAVSAASVSPRRPVTEFFGVAAVADSVVFVIDRSASMGMQNRLGRAVNEVKASLAHLPPSTKFQVVTYARAPVLANRATDLLTAGAASIDAVSDELTALRAEGGTDHVRALKKAMLLAPQVVYFLTDEDDLSITDVDAITQYNRGRTRIHAICLVEPATSNSPMRVLALRNGGQFRVAR